MVAAAMSAGRRAAPPSRSRIRAAATAAAAEPQVPSTQSGTVNMAAPESGTDLVAGHHSRQDVAHGLPAARTDAVSRQHQRQPHAVQPGRPRAPA